MHPTKQIPEINLRQKLLTNDLCFRLVAMSALVSVCSCSVAADKVAIGEDPSTTVPLSVRLIDEDGRPVVGAIVGVMAHDSAVDHAVVDNQMEADKQSLVDEDGWKYWLGTKSDAEGVATIHDARQYGHVCLVARHAGRKLIGIEKIASDNAHSDEQVVINTLTLHPECRVSGRLISSQLAKEGRSLGSTNVNLEKNGSPALSFEPDEKDGVFQFILPPGDFNIEAYGSNLHFMKRSITVVPGQRQLKIDTLDLRATRLTLMQGKPAIELRGVTAWKNSAPVKLSDFIGRCVILDFWGYWCGPCVAEMPELFTLYDKYQNQGLEIIGIHIDLGDAEKEPIDSAKKLDAKLSSIRNSLWHGRDVPYPVAIVTGKDVPFDPDDTSHQARCLLAAEYGIMFYPTLVLIDRRGLIVGEFNPTDSKAIERLEMLLLDK